MHQKLMHLVESLSNYRLLYHHPIPSTALELERLSCFRAKLMPSPPASVAVWLGGRTALLPSARRAPENRLELGAGLVWKVWQIAHVDEYSQYRNRNQSPKQPS